MIQRLYLWAVLLPMFTMVQAQVSKSDYEKSVDYLNFETVLFSLESDNETIAKQFEQEISAISVTYQQMRDFLEKRNYQKNVELLNEINELKTLNFEEDLSQQSIVEFLSSKVFEDQKSYPKSYDFAHKENRMGTPLWKEFIRELQLKLNTVFTVEVNEVSDMPQHTDYAEHTIDLMDDGTLEEDFPTHSRFLGIEIRVWILVLVTNFLFSILVFWLLARFVSDDIHKLDKKWMHELKAIPKVTSSVNSGVLPANLTKEIKHLQDKIQALEVLIATWQHSKVEPEPKTERTQTPVVEAIAQQTEETPAEIFYQATPDNDGNFNDMYSSLHFKEGASIYKFTKTAVNRAYFQVDNQVSSVKLALQFPNRNIDPACEALNAYNSKAKRIVTVQKGEVELQGTLWICKIKAQIRYEN